MIDQKPWCTFSVLDHKVDRATEMGVVPNCALVSWLCPISARSTGDRVLPGR